MVIDFGENPLVNSLIEKKDLKKKEKVYPLMVEQCQDCKLVQIVEPIDSHKIYRDADYLYFSSDMPTLDDYFKEFARDVKERFLKEGDFVVEIGSNDGIWLKNFDKYKVLGIDPASNVVLRALQKGILTISDFFSERLAKNIVREYGKAKIIMGANCIAHIDNLQDLMRGIRVLLEDDGVFVVECNYWGGMVKNKNYALIYHDHFSYFSLKVWVEFAEKFGLKVFDAWVTPAQGGSLRLFMGKDSNPMTQRCRELLAEEETTNLNSYETCQKYEKECFEEAKRFGDLIRRLNGEGKKIAGYGAAAKGFSLIRLAGIDERHLCYFVDDSPAKQGKYAPVNHIPVISREEAEKQLPDYFVITAPNYAKVIMEKEKDFINKGGKFILYGEV